MKSFNLTVIVISIVLVVIGLTLNIVFGQSQDILYYQENFGNVITLMNIHNDWIQISSLNLSN